MIWTNEGLDVHLTNVSDADMKITQLPNFQNHLNITRKDESNSVSVKEVIVHRKKNARTVIMTTTKIYMNIWHVCLIMKKFLLEVSVTVRNLPIGF